MFLGVKKFEILQATGLRNKKTVLSKYVTFDAASFLKSTISQQVMKTKDVSQREEVDVIPPSLVGSVSIEISPNVTSGGDRVAVLNAEQVDLIAAKRTKKNPQK